MLENRLKKVFKKIFCVDEKQIYNAKINKLNNWDSFSHINLIIEIEKSFNIKKIKSEDIAKLKSYLSFLKYLKRNVKK